MVDPETAVATLVGALASLAAISSGVGSVARYFHERGQKRRMESIPATAGHVPGEHNRPPVDPTVSLEDHFRRLLQAERDRTAQLEAEIRERAIEANALRGEIRSCNRVNAELGGELAAKTYALEASEKKAAAIGETLLAHGLSLPKTAARTPGSQPSWPAVIVEEDGRKTDRPEPVDIHSAPTPRPGRNPIT